MVIQLSQSFMVTDTSPTYSVHCTDMILFYADVINENIEKYQFQGWYLRNSTYHLLLVIFIISAVPAVFSLFLNNLSTLQLLYFLILIVFHIFSETKSYKWDIHPSCIWCFLKKEEEKHANEHERWV